MIIIKILKENSSLKMEAASFSKTLVSNYMASLPKAVISYSSP
jgi:hypothetical protein